jgi:midasin (ATPase involved in ribosome maturation)
LWNVYNYFQQFSLTVSNKIKDLRAPIEKKLKDYVKIVRWKDINYWAIKETVDKSHKTLHKYVREFQVSEQFKRKFAETNCLDKRTDFKEHVCIRY